MEDEVMKDEVMKMRAAILERVDVITGALELSTETMQTDMGAIVYLAGFIAAENDQPKEEFLEFMSNAYDAAAAELAMAKLLSGEDEVKH